MLSSSPVEPQRNCVPAADRIVYADVMQDPARLNGSLAHDAVEYDDRCTALMCGVVPAERETAGGRSREQQLDGVLAPAGHLGSSKKCATAHAGSPLAGVSQRLPRLNKRRPTLPLCSIPCYRDPVEALRAQVSCALAATTAAVVAGRPGGVLASMRGIAIDQSINDLLFTRSPALAQSALDFANDTRNSDIRDDFPLLSALIQAESASRLSPTSLSSCKKRCRLRRKRAQAPAMDTRGSTAINVTTASLIRLQTLDVQASDMLVADTQISAEWLSRVQAATCSQENRTLATNAQPYNDPTTHSVCVVEGGMEGVPGVVCRCSQDNVWGCVLHCVYRTELLLAHRGLSLSIASGPPGLELEQPERAITPELPACAGPRMASRWEPLRNVGRPEAGRRTAMAKSRQRTRQEWRCPRLVSCSPPPGLNVGPTCTPAA